MSTTIPVIEPDFFIKGERVRFTLTNGDYLASAGWSARMDVVGEADSFTWSSAASGDAHAFDISPADSAKRKSGRYRYQLWFVLGTTDARVFREGELVIEDSLNLKDKSDTRSYARRSLDVIRAVIEGRLDADMENYTIAGRSVTLMSSQDLRDWEDYFSRKVQVERNEDKRARGKSVQRYKIHRVRFVDR